MQYKMLKNLVKEAGSIASDVEAALAEADPEIIQELANRQKSLLEELEKAGPLPEDLFVEMQEMNMRTMEMIEKISIRKSQTVKSLQAAGNKKKLLSVYGGGA